MSHADTERSLSNTERAVLELRRSIFSGELAAGSDHLEAELAERLKMSRTPVREAALVLEAQGLLQLRPRKGVRILPVSPKDMREIYDILIELEGLAAERAAERGYADADLNVLSETLKEMDRALYDGDLGSWAEADDAFHVELVRLGGNMRLASVVAMLWDQVRRVRNITLYMRPMPDKSNQDHHRVVEAIRNGDPVDARQQHRTHRREAQSMLLSLLERHHLRNI